jgi:drug/metabolite transporter (DMT)-like permease
MQSTQPKPIISYSVLFLGVVCASSGAIFIRFAQSDGAGSLEIAAYRLLFSTIILTPIILSRYTREIQALSKSILLTIILGGCFLAVHFATWITSLQYTTIASSVVFVSSTPIWVCLYTVIVKKEKLSTGLIIGLFLALVGGTIIALSDSCIFTQQGMKCSISFAGSKAFIGNGLALLGAVMAAGYLLVGKEVRQKISLTPYIFLVYGIAAVLLTITSLSFSLQIIQIPVQSIVWLVCLAVFPQLVGHTSYNWSLKRFSTAYVSIAMQGEPIGSTLLGVLLFKEIPTPVKVLGVAIIMVGIISVTLQEKQDGSI